MKTAIWIDRVVHSTTVAAIATEQILRHNGLAMKDPNPTDANASPTSLAEVLTRLRLELGLSMYELAKRTGINRSTLMRIEDGTTTNPDTATLNTLARGLGVEPELFYDAVWEDIDQPLPSPALYFRSKYQFSDEQIAELEASVRRLTEHTKAGPDNPKISNPKGGHS